MKVKGLSPLLPSLPLRLLYLNYVRVIHTHTHYGSVWEIISRPLLVMKVSGKLIKS